MSYFLSMATADQCLPTSKMETSESNENLPDICIKWSGSEYKISELRKSDNVGKLKDRIHEQTGVQPARQKLLGIKYKGPLNDAVLLSALGLTASTKIMMMGTREEEIAKVLEPPPDMPEVINDLDIEDEEIEICNRADYLAKVEKRIETYKFNILNEPREDKKLLVLDIDYTLFEMATLTNGKTHRQNEFVFEFEIDHKSVAESGQELMRPYLHEFLETAYSKYDIVIWSATSMKWIEAKMQELGVTTNPNYKISFMVDSLAMITVDTSKYGVIEVKPLGVIWGKFPQWNKTNTIMFDDLRRNFIMNPLNGLKIRPFKNAHLTRDKDNELVGLSKYLMLISEEKDLSTLDHNHWERYEERKERHHKRHKPDDPQ